MFRGIIKVFFKFFFSKQKIPIIYAIKFGGAVAQAVECATPGEEVAGSIPAVAARSLLVGSLSV